MTRKRWPGYKVSLRYKLALPVWIFVFLILVLLTHTTLKLIRSFVVQTFEARIFSEAEAFAESIQPDFVLQNFGKLRAHINWFSARHDVRGVRVEDVEGMTILRSKAYPDVPDPLVLDKHFIGAARPYGPGLYLVSIPMGLGTKELGRIQVFFSSQNVDIAVRSIYRERIFLSFLAGLAIAVITAAWTWFTIRPIFALRNTVLQILRGFTSARARIQTGDEIEELADAFNEMVSRLQQSLTNLRARSEALEESEERYRMLVENASDVIWLLSPEGEIMFLSQPFSGLSQKDLLRKGLSFFLSFHMDESVQRFEAAFEQVKNQKIPVLHLSTDYLHPVTRAEVFYSTNLTPVLSRDRGLRAIQAVSRDVTELKRIELMKEHLIRDVAHELKTPVAKFDMTLQWLAKEIQNKSEGARYKGVLDLMRRNADLLMNTINEIMDLSRLESGSERLARKPCDLNRILERVCEDLAPFVRKKNLVFEKHLTSGTLSLEADEAMLYRLFVNLIQNAVKFTAHGKISVGSRRENGRLQVLVTDTGIGLEEEDLTRVFDRFFQKTPATEGMGVGLALAREIVHLHGGQIHAESEGLGKGASFIVEFPPV